MQKQLLAKGLGAYYNLISLFSAKTAAKKAFTLFCSPRKGQITTEQQDFLETANRIDLSYKETSIPCYHWEGNEHSILFAHGWESNAARWQPLIQLFREKGYTVIALDAPKHGNSKSKLFHVPLYTECINVAVQKFQPTILAGHSLGAMTSAYFQYKYPNPFTKKMVLMAPPAYLSRIMDDYKELLGYNKRIMVALENLVEKKFEMRFVDFSIPKFIKEMSTPETLIIHDTQDDITPFNEGKAISENLSNAKLVATSGHGHSLISEEVYKEVLHFCSL